VNLCSREVRRIVNFARRIKTRNGRPPQLAASSFPAKVPGRHTDIAKLLDLMIPQ
jgi:hypothetical protein